jgi:hypothetical protein
MDKVFVHLSLMTGLLKLQANGWQSKVRYEIRFFLCGMFSYLSFSVFKLLGDLFAGEENDAIAYVFDKPPYLILMSIAICFGYFGLYMSIIAAALFTSLLPKT